MKIRLLIALFVLTGLHCVPQIRSAKITYERKTNLYKKYKYKAYIKEWVRENDKTKVDEFELFVTDTLSLFRPVESDLKEDNSWMTKKNTVYQHLGRENTYMIKNFYGEVVHITDSLRTRKWKVTGSSRKIAGYECRKAVWQANDSTRIYAWFSLAITPSTGPETFNGLPGTILGLATEDGGVVYFAKKVELTAVQPAVFEIPRVKKVYKIDILKERLEKKYGHESWFAGEMHEYFGLW